MMCENSIQTGDYVTYRRTFKDGFANGFEVGAGYVLRALDDNWVVRSGEREVVVPKVDCLIHAKQYRLEV